jgi:hypothetical protein
MLWVWMLLIAVPVASIIASVLLLLLLLPKLLKLLHCKELCFLRDGR